MRRLMTAFTLLTAGATAAAAQDAVFPDSPQGRLAAGFLTAANAPDEEAMIRFQAANFSEDALKRRSEEQRRALTRSLREQAGRLSLVRVVSTSASRLVAEVEASNVPGSLLIMTIEFVGGDNPKINTVNLGPG